MRLILLLALTLPPLLSCQKVTKKETPQSPLPTHPEKIDWPPLRWVKPNNKNLHEVIHQKSTTSTKTVIEPLKDISKFYKIELEGDHFYPQASPNGNDIVFVSKNLPDHKHTELYTYNLATKTTTRLTFQKGVVSHPSFHPHHPKVVYSTDRYENSERVDIALKKLKEVAFQGSKKSNWSNSEIKLLNSDITLFSLDTKEHKRLTQSSGSDDQPHWIDNGRRILFSTTKNSSSNNLASVDLNGRQFNSIEESPNDLLYPRYSNDQKKLVFIRYFEKTIESKVVVKELSTKNTTELALPAGLHLFPFWDLSGDWLFFSSNFEDGFFHIYVVHRLGHCLQRVSSPHWTSLSPSLSFSGDQIFYSRFEEGHWTLGWRRFSLPETCLIQSP